MYRTYLGSADIYFEEEDGTLASYETVKINRHLSAPSVEKLLNEVAEVLFSKRKDLSAFQFAGFEGCKDGKNNAIILADYIIKGNLNYSPEEQRAFKIRDNYKPASLQFTIEKYEHIGISENEFDFLD